MRAHELVEDGVARRAYTAVDAARALGVTAKTVVAWADPDRRGGPRLAAWAPRTIDPGQHRWLVDADAVDRLLADQSSGAEAASAERAQLDEERHLFEMERSMFMRERTQQLEDDNARLRDEVARLREQLSSLGDALRALTR